MNKDSNITLLATQAVKAFLALEKAKDCPVTKTNNTKKFNAFSQACRDKKISITEQMEIFTKIKSSILEGTND